ncbi:MAG: aldo/keto reductase [Oscillospiraceae bacterium]|nr:aldo/keto reductase [Oscillospiraceae bacterium]
MKMIPFGKTGMTVSATGFGAIPIQRISTQESTLILRKAYDSGITFFDTARGYTDSETKIGAALSDVRDKIVITTKTHARDYDAAMKDLETSLSNLKTDYIDVYQLHNPNYIPKPGDENRLYEAVSDAKKAGKIRHIGITNHRLDLANQAIDSGLYESLQFPFSCISSDEDIELAKKCDGAGMGFIAMKALAGGLITNAKAAFTFLRQYEFVVPIWGIQLESELDEFIALEKSPPQLDEAMMASIEKDRAELSGSFCRGCGYCLPCPAEIPIPMAARLSYMMGRSRFEQFLEDGWAAQMERIKDCRECGHCKEHCPYGLDTPEVLKAQYEMYCEFRKTH